MPNQPFNSKIRLSLVTLCMFGFSCIESSAHAASLKFIANGHPVKSLETAELIKISSLKTLTVNNPTDSTIKSYHGVSLIPLLDAVFNLKWQNHDAIKFTASDGYQPIIPVSVINKHQGIIAIGENGQRGFSLLVRNNGETIDPGPFFWCGKISKMSLPEKNRG